MVGHSLIIVKTVAITAICVYACTEHITSKIKKKKSTKKTYTYNYNSSFSCVKLYQPTI